LLDLATARWSRPPCTCELYGAACTVTRDQEVTESKLDTLR
jgi:hypothetical protein